MSIKDALFPHLSWISPYVNDPKIMPKAIDTPMKIQSENLISSKFKIIDFNNMAHFKKFN